LGQKPPRLTPTSRPRIAAIDIYRSAKIYIDQHGDQAALQAAMQADGLLDAGDMDGATTWLKIVKAVEVLQATEPDGVTH